MIFRSRRERAAAAGPDRGSEVAGAEVAGAAAPEADLLGADASADPGAGAPGVESGDQPGPESPVRDTAADRRLLIDLLIYAWDRAKSPGVWERLTQGLAQAGVTVLRPDGELFDAARHEAGGIELTDDVTRHDRIAETELAGFVDGDRVIREPVVVVYRPA